MENKKRVYLAAPLFNEAELAYNRELKKALSPYFDVFLPQEDGLLLRDISSESVSNDLAEGKIFNADITAMNDSDIIIAVLNGAHIDEGVAFELGYCFAKGKRCIGIKEDVRQALPTGNNPMISKSCEKILDSKISLISWISS
ncbi:nucleoside 2-deoxyribosyltransferase [Pantoea dispersa]|uniref:nucleoside 2-deoxyribosyltransferase n=1 Tax=Pantoea dispersa TaxID=59814 RepID=UPI0007364DB3|nr:nucleoside 2-deoxyribosyltransferase [Pantoea dispersa]KTS32076.1 nucleoside 2-deoxyribosyltransferase [Pantoea dispersa]KTS52807.1 nucleoside 2-deoxyribosyltransferase [Pantoea dispersa]